LFHCVPASGIKTWEDYRDFVPSGKKVGHIHKQERYTAQQIKDELSKIRGHVTEMPTDFLERAGLSELSAAVNPLTMPIYL
jgi:phospholipase D1/2